MYFFTYDYLQSCPLIRQRNYIFRSSPFFILYICYLAESIPLYLRIYEFCHLLSCFLAPKDSFLKQRTIELYGAERIVVARHRISYKIRIAIGIDYTRSRYAHLGRMPHRGMLSQDCIEGAQEDTQIRQPCHSLKLVLGIRKYAQSPFSRMRELLAFSGRFIHQMCDLRIS